MFLHQKPIEKILDSWKIIALLSVLFSLLYLTFLLFAVPLQYRSDAQVYIYSQNSYGVDPYTAVKASERIGENLSSILYTDDFYDRVMKQGDVEFDKAYFRDLSARDRKKAWEKAFSSGVEYGTGILSLSAYNEDRDEANKLLQAILSVLENEAPQYVGSDIQIRIVNNPIVTQFPVRPNLAFQGIFAWVLSLTLLSAFVVLKKD